MTDQLAFTKLTTEIIQETTKAITALAEQMSRFIDVHRADVAAINEKIAYHSENIAALYELHRHENEELKKRLSDLEAKENAR